MSTVMETFVCSKGHASTEPDFCSECGARIGASSAAGNGEGVASAAAAPESCPACGVVREQQDIAFCEICGYNFVTGAPGTEAALAPAPASAPASVTPPGQPEPEPAVRVWQVEVLADPALHQPGSPEPPADLAPVTLTLSAPVSLIGRRSGARAIDPEIDLSHDSAVSHRHALLTLDAAGRLLLRDIGASNGTRLNDRTIEPLKDHALADGDEITLGHWTRLRLHAGN